eukprot:6200526-Pleurochrysis_carterae.AAC.3
MQALPRINLAQRSRTAFHHSRLRLAGLLGLSCCFCCACCCFCKKYGKIEEPPEFADMNVEYKPNEQMGMPPASGETTVVSLSRVRASQT